VERARFTPAEVIKLTLDFYKRNYIEGLFLSSGIIRSPDYTMEQLVEVARALREDHGFRGYIHLKTIAEADPLLIEQARKEEQRSRKANRTRGRNNAPKFAPGGQSTQMIVGADGSSDADIINTSTRLYSGYQMRRVYYSAFSPIPDASKDLPPIAPPLVREHRLYQADWLYRFYNFKPAEILSSATDGLDARRFD